MMMQGDDLRALRKAMNLRQAALARGLGMTPQFIGMMERGEKAIEPRTAMAVLYLVDHPEARPDVEAGDDPIYSPGQLFDLWEESRKLADGRTWGRWRFSADSLTLDLDSREDVVDRDGDGNEIMGRTERYYVPLTDMVDAESLTNWIGQIAGKGWGAVAVGQFVAALNDIFGIQGRFVQAGGFENAKEVKAYLLGMLAAAEEV
ncbi:hypothetical protein BWQ93_06030 [Sphingopyxis sp. QXT-31]|uniref:helix-turn-helix transcriptional regulator n=1 Tax=Sphingopyxis sp. QXT-31 TaxID=1357916 RepID=UPI0009791B4E|nr:helix-turn-helix transcriptional regulator [Sphingopyxis sp. QXT-31]APZ98088.1 hypothetical protein BWQ93_06030 [Sphingopyxis sp. QXT-31]